MGDRCVMKLSGIFQERVLINYTMHSHSRVGCGGGGIREEGAGGERRIRGFI